ncbi:MAG: hypothetical protein AAGD96_33180, partial [Chloroflexota bacterium]
MLEKINLGLLEHGPHGELIGKMAEMSAADERIHALWIGGSLASGNGDFFSDIDFRVAVEPGTLDNWVNPDWEKYLPNMPTGGTFMRFGEQALLHHMLLSDGTLIDFFVQDTERDNFEPNIVILACRDAEFKKKLEGFSKPAAPLLQDINGAVARRFLVDYWIITYKEMKALARKYDLSGFVGLNFERLALL